MKIYTGTRWFSQVKFRSSKISRSRAPTSCEFTNTRGCRRSKLENLNCILYLPAAIPIEQVQEHKRGTPGESDERCYKKIKEPVGAKHYDTLTTTSTQVGCAKWEIFLALIIDMTLPLKRTPGSNFHHYVTAWKTLYKRHKNLFKTTSRKLKVVLHMCPLKSEIPIIMRI